MSLPPAADIDTSAVDDCPLSASVTLGVIVSAEVAEVAEVGVASGARS